MNNVATSNKIRLSLGFVLFTVGILLYLFLTSRIPESPEALLVRLEDEVRAELEAEDATNVKNGIKLSDEPNDRLIRFLNVLLGKVDVMEESPASSVVARQISEALARELEANEEKYAIQKQVDDESIVESVTRLRGSRFSVHFSPKLAGTLDYGFTASAVEQRTEMEKDPRVSKLMGIAKHGSDEERQLLYNLLIEEYRNYENDVLNGALDDESWRFWEGPAAAIPLLLGELDASGETLPVLIEMADTYAKSLLGPHFNTEESPLLNGKAIITSYSMVSAIAVETVLMNLAQSSTYAFPELEEYLSTRSSIQELFLQDPSLPHIESVLLASVSKNHLEEMNIIELMSHGNRIPLQPELWISKFPNWFEPGNYEWAILAFGNRVNQYLENR